MRNELYNNKIKIISDVMLNDIYPISDKYVNSYS
jgi:hypothetical protein